MELLSSSKGTVPQQAVEPLTAVKGQFPPPYRTSCPEPPHLSLLATFCGGTWPQVPEVPQGAVAGSGGRRVGCASEMWCVPAPAQLSAGEGIRAGWALLWGSSPEVRSVGTACELLSFSTQEKINVSVLFPSPTVFQELNCFR